MAKAGYIIATPADVALVASTAKTVLSVLAPAQFGTDWKKVSFSFDGVTAANVGVLIELCSLDSTSAGTGTAATITQVRGRAITAGFTGKYAFTAEPTVLTPIKRTRITPNGGALWYDWPLGDSWDSPVSAGFALRMTAGVGVNVNAEFDVERC